MTANFSICDGWVVDIKNDAAVLVLREGKAFIQTATGYEDPTMLDAKQLREWLNENLDKAIELLEAKNGKKC